MGEVLSHEVFLLTSITWTNTNFVVKGDLCLSFQGLNKSFGIRCTNLGLRGGVREIIYLSTMVLQLGGIFICLVLMLFDPT